MKHLSKIFLLFLSFLISSAHAQPLSPERFQEIMDIFESYGVRFVSFSFTDLTGALKEVVCPLFQAKTALTKGLAFDGSSIPGCTQITQSDMLLVPDLNTITLIPWCAEFHRTARIMCDMYINETTPHDADARVLLRRFMKEAEALGYSLMVGPELEFFIFNDASLTTPVDNNRYFDSSTNASWHAFVCNTMNMLLAQGINVEKWHHEVAPGQHEISIRYGNALETADRIILARHTLKVCAQQAGLHLSFMPKPIIDQNGSAMHVHFSLFDLNKGVNAFADQTGTALLSPIAQQCIEGVLCHVQDATILLNSSINSFKRLIPGFEAPVNICWGAKNRSALIRIPHVAADEPHAVRAEIRSPDSLSNPYLVFAFILAASLDGIAYERTLRSAVEDNLYHCTQEELRTRNIATLPHSLTDALHRANQSSFMKSFLGTALFDELMKLKVKELALSQRSITHWEKERDR